ncbi:MAG: type VI secretion system protein ImpM, partial [Halieaceae bacterium]
MNEVGCFGKLPAHGDFIWQALPTEFVTPWDNWLQENLLSLQGSMGDDWLETYLCGAIWRFVISDETLGPNSWGGIITPSVDMVGRYFPFTIACELPRYASVISSARTLSPWFEHLEDCILGALENALPLEEIMKSARSVVVPEVGEREADEQAAARDLWCVT